MFFYKNIFALLLCSNKIKCWSKRNYVCFNLFDAVFLLCSISVSKNSIIGFIMKKCFSEKNTLMIVFLLMVSEKYNIGLYCSEINKN